MGARPGLLFHTVVLVGTALGAGSCHHQSLSADDGGADVAVATDQDASPNGQPDAPAFTVPDAGVPDATPFDAQGCDLACQFPRTLCGCQCCVIIL
jgi:hypothetical protein